MQTPSKPEAIVRVARPADRSSLAVTYLSDAVPGELAPNLERVR